MQDRVAHGNKRFVNFLVDYLIFPLVSTLLLGPLSFFLVFANFFILESWKGKTLGKYLTKTTVVNRNWSKSGILRIFVRTLSRFFPLDFFSFAFSLHPVGFHDTLSGTAVVDDIDLIEVSDDIDSNDDQISKYELLIKGVHLASISTLMFLERYPELKAVLNRSKQPGSDWDFFMTVGGVGIYLERNQLSKEDGEDLLGQLAEFNKEMPPAIHNLAKFLAKDSEHRLTTQVGFWVLWNIGGEAPTHKESERLAPAIGNYLMNVVKDFE